MNIGIMTAGKLYSLGFSFPYYQSRVLPGMVYQYHDAEWVVGGRVGDALTAKDLPFAEKGTWLPNREHLMQWLAQNQFAFVIACGDGVRETKCKDTITQTEYKANCSVTESLAVVIRKILKRRERKFDTENGELEIPLTGEENWDTVREMVLALYALGYASCSYQEEPYPTDGYLFSGGKWIVGGCCEENVVTESRRFIKDGVWLPDETDFLIWLENYGFSYMIGNRDGKSFEAECTDTITKTTYYTKAPTLWLALSKTIRKILLTKERKLADTPKEDWKTLEIVNE